MPKPTLTPEALTPLIQQGLNQRQIAEQFGLSTQAVSGYIRNRPDLKLAYNQAQERVFSHNKLHHPLVALSAQPSCLIFKQQQMIIHAAFCNGYISPSARRPDPKNSSCYFLACLAVITSQATDIHPDALPKILNLTRPLVTALVRAASSNPSATIMSIAQSLPCGKNLNPHSNRVGLYRTTAALCTALHLDTPGGQVKGVRGQGHNWNALRHFLHFSRPSDLTPQAYAEAVHRTVATAPVVAANLPVFEATALAQRDPAAATRRLLGLVTPPFRRTRPLFLQAIAAETPTLPSVLGAQPLPLPNLPPLS